MASSAVPKAMLGGFLPTRDGAVWGYVTDHGDFAPRARAKHIFFLSPVILLDSTGSVAPDATERRAQRSGPLLRAMAPAHRTTLNLPLVSREWKNGSHSSYKCTPFLHSLLTKGKKN